jgi:NAD(P)-dependent dehydrogenase (short-subunit alcohol dehydrogenase family)
MQDLKGKTAIVTGAASGIGSGIAKALAGAGMNLVLADIQQGPLTDARGAIEALGVKAIDVVVDVSDAASVAAAAHAAEQAFGKLHVAVNNAGVAMHGTRIEDVGVDDVLTHAGERDAVKARHARIEAAFDRAEAWGKTR